MYYEIYMMGGETGNEFAGTVCAVHGADGALLVLHSPGAEWILVSRGRVVSTREQARCCAINSFD